MVISNFYAVIVKLSNKSLKTWLLLIILRAQIGVCMAKIAMCDQDTVLMKYIWPLVVPLRYSYRS